ncbi:MAG TPA: NAD(P)/FAD-dependent oxidoreductase [Caldilineaceae bacterium]|nr:NAD(P)/FAD-dependent oxidoreductase [Caldilineaceae bacterium]
MYDDPVVYDVAIIGAGVVGAAIARELAKYQVRLALVEAAPDVGMGTSKANPAIWHPGFDATPGSLEAQLLRRGYPLLGEFMAAAGVPIERLGALLVAWTAEQEAALPALLARAHDNGVTDVRPVSAQEIYQREPHLQSGVRAGLFVPGEGILCTFSLPLAYATQAVLNGVTLKLNHRVQALVRGEDGHHRLHTSGGVVCARFLVNAAGLYADEIDRMAGHQRFTVTPRRGQLIVFDKLARPLLNHILLPTPTATTKGVLISPTVYGNILLGPTAEDLPDKTDTGTSVEGLQQLLEKGQALLPALLREEVTAIYAGLRAATEHKDYQIELYPDEQYLCVGGIRSTGVSASLGIAAYVVDQVATQLTLAPKATFVPVQMPAIGEAQVRPYQSSQLIAANPDYGRVVCFCERVTVGELKAAACGPLPARTLDGLRRRTRVMQGRCQGFNCQAAAATLLAQESKQTVQQLLALET